MKTQREKARRELHVNIFRRENDFKTMFHETTSKVNASFVFTADYVNIFFIFEGLHTQPYEHKPH